MVVGQEVGKPREAPSTLLGLGYLPAPKMRSIPRDRLHLPTIYSFTDRINGSLH